MKKITNIRNLIIIVLGITIIIMTIAFSLVSTKLSYKNKEEQIFNIAITKIEAATPIKGGLTPPTSTKEVINNGLTAKFNFTLNSPNDELAYIITIKNKGNIKARLIDLIDNPDYINTEKHKASIYPVTITHDSIKDKVLAPNDEVKVKLLVTYNITPTPMQINVQYELSVLAAGRN